MKKAIIFLIFSFLLAGCTPYEGTVSGAQKYTFYQISELKGMSFRHPVGALVLEDASPKAVSFDGCKVYFGKEYMKEEQGFEIKEKEDDQFNFRAFYKDDEIVRYVAVLKGQDFAFWIDEKVEACLDFMDGVTDSFTDKPIYYNERFGFQVELLPDFKVENLGDGEGIMMRKGYEIEPTEAIQQKQFVVEIGAFGAENVLKYPTLADFLADKYTGYTMEFFQDGVFVDESLSKSEAVTHYFILREDTIYEAYMRISSADYNLYKDAFRNFAATLVVAD